MGVQIANNAWAELAGSISNSDTSIDVVTSALFPAVTTGSGDYFYATLINSSNQLEIVKVTDITGNTLTVERGAQGTTARAYTASDLIELRITADTITELLTENAAGALAAQVAAEAAAEPALAIDTTGGSTADAIAADFATSPGTLSDHLWAIVEMGHGANTIKNPTFDLNSLGPKTVVRDDDQPLLPGDTGGVGYFAIYVFSVSLDKWVLTNPKNPRVQHGLRWVEDLQVTHNSGNPDEVIDIAPGRIMDDTNTHVIEVPTAFTKSIVGAFTAGTGNSGLASGDSLSGSTWYGLFLVSKSSDLTDSDFVFATTRAKALASTGVTGVYDVIRLIYVVKVDGLLDILPTVPGIGDRHMWKDRVQNQNVVPGSTGVPTSSTNITMSAPPFHGVILKASILASAAGADESVSLSIVQTDQNFGGINDLSIQTPSGATVNRAQSDTSIELKVDGSSQVKVKGTRDTVLGSGYNIGTLGWIFDREVIDLV